MAKLQILPVFSEVILEVLKSSIELVIVKTCLGFELK